MSDKIEFTEKTQEEIQQDKIKMQFAKMSNMIVRDFQREKTVKSIFRKYTKEDIIEYLQNPAKGEKQLRNISSFLYNNFTHYKRLINYFADMYLFRYTIKPFQVRKDEVDAQDFKKNYLNISDTIKMMNIPHEFRKILKVCFKQDIFYGYEHSTDDSYFIQSLDADFCQVSSVEDGVFNFSFDFTYFDKYSYKLNMYPKEFNSKYKKYKNNIRLRWQELDSRKTICIKVNEEIDYPIPPFIGLFEEVYDIQDYKSLKKSKKEIDNYQLLAMKIPIDEKGNSNDFKIDLDLALEFYNKTAQTLPDNVGLFLSPMDVDPMKFEQDKISNNTVTEAEDLFWSSAGVNGNLFNSKGNSGSVVSLSTKTDEAIVFAVIRQMERWLNRKLKFISTKYNYEFNFIDITINNEKDKIDEYIKLAQYGVPIKTDLAQLTGQSIAEMDVMTWVENELFNIPESWIPLSSSHTQNGESDNKSGTPTKSNDSISASGEKSRKNDAHKSDKLVSK